MQPLDTLRLAVGKKAGVRVSRRIDEYRIHGYVVAFGRKLVVLRVFHEFYDDGYMAIRHNDVTEVRSGPHERHWDRMCDGEGLLDHLSLPEGIDPDTPKSLLNSLYPTREIVIIEREDLHDAKKDCFNIGRIESVGETSCSMLFFDSLGVWDRVPEEIAYHDVTVVKFDTKYGHIYSKYLRESD